MQASENKRFCVLQVTPDEPNTVHYELFYNKKESDLYFVTYKKENKAALKYCPNTVWSETRNTLAALVPKKYDYYMFLDQDLILEPRFDLDAYEQILQDLEFNPAVLTYYPGRGIHSPLVHDHNFLESRDYSCIPFTHNGIKIVHKSLMKWFFPLFVKYKTDTDACHMFNIQEIPFLRDIILSHKMIHHNSPSDTEAEKVYNKNPAYTKLKMDQMWAEVRPYYKKLNLLVQGNYNINDSLSIKSLFVHLFKTKNITPRVNSREIDYYDKDKISRFFDIENPLFDSIK